MNTINMKKFCLASLVIFLIAGSASAGGWWNYEWKFRRAVTIPKTKPTGLSGDDIAVITIPTGSKMRRDARDIRVATLTLREMPCRVLMIGPGDLVRVAFAIRPGVTKYFIYFGNPGAPAGKKKLDIRRGVLLSTWEYPGGGTGTLRQMRKIFKRARKFVGQGFRDRIFLGYNPFGPQKRIAGTFTAYLVCPRDGRYVFSTSSQDSSFLLIDDKLVVDNRGWHRPQRDVRKRGGITLKAGLHKLTFYHVCMRRDPIVVAAWRIPGTRRICVIPPAAFAPIVRAKAGAMEQLGKLGVDFLAKHEGEAFLKNRYYQRYSFRMLATGGSKRVKNWQWDFGDGQTSQSTRAEHIYLRPGVYTVTLIGKTPSAVMKRTNRIYVSRPWNRVTRHNLDSIRNYAKIVSGYDFNRLKSEILAESAILFERTKRMDDLLKAGKAFVARKKVSGKSAGQIVPIYADALVAKGHPKRAAEALTKGAAMTSDPAVASTLMVKSARVTLEKIGDSVKAMAIFKTAIKQYASLADTSAIRNARIGIGDSWRAQGVYDKAKLAYKQAGIGNPIQSNRVVFTRGDLARHVEDYLRRRELTAAGEKLDQWQNIFPADKLNGYWSLLRVKWLIAKKRYSDAATEAIVLVRVNPTSHHCPQLLMQAANAYRKSGQNAKAKKILKRIATEYPESKLSETTNSHR